MTRLTDRQARFVDAYLQTNSSNQAYRKVYGTKNMSSKAASVEASRMLKHPKISLAIEQGQEQRRELVIKNASLDAAWVLKETQKRYDECVANGDASRALKALEMIGRHRDIQAWNDRLQIEDKTDFAAILERRAQNAEALRYRG